MTDESHEGAGRQQTPLGTVRNASVLLELMSERPGFLPLSEIAERSGLSPSTAHRLLRSLLLVGLVQQDPKTSRYGLGQEIVRLSESYLSGVPVLRTLAPYLVELRALTKGTVLVGILIRGSVLYADRVDADETGGMFREATRVHDALMTAAGRVLIGAADDNVWKEAVAASERGWEFSEDDKAAWADAPFVVVGPGEYRLSVEVAVPVQDRGGRVLAALAAMASPQSFTDEALNERVIPALLRAARAAGQAVSDF